MSNLLNTPAKLDRSRQARTQRRQAVRAHRAAGLTLRQIAERYGISVGLAHYLCKDVRVLLPNAWHRQRLPKERPLPPLAALHRYRLGV